MAFIQYECNGDDDLDFFKSEKRFEHISQTNVHSPVWICICCFSSPLLRKNILRKYYILQINGFHFECTLKCLFRL